MKPHYHNTTNLSGPALMQAVAKAEKQDEAVLLIYKETRKAWSPSQIHASLEKAGRLLPITSVRRAITNLTNTGDLVKCVEQRVGLYGALEGLWQINPKKHPAPVSGEQQKLFGT